MPLSIAKPKLEKSILDAFEKALSTAKNAGEKDVSAQIRIDLAKDLTNAIDAYVLSAQVDIVEVQSTVPPGVVVAAPPPTGAGITTSPGVAKHVGFGKLQ